GGSLLPAPTNGTSNVYKTTIVLENVGTACAVFSLAIVLSDETDYTYGTTDMAAAAGGYLYIWLPDGAKTTAVQAETGAYTGLVTTITAGTATGLFSKTADTELPTIETVSPDGTGAPLNGEIAITFGETMHTTTAGSVSFDGGTTVLSSGNWSNSNRTYTVSYTALTNNTVYVISVSGFADISGNIMEADSTHSFTTVVMCGNGAYLVESDGDSAYSAGYTDDGLLHLTVNSGVSGFTFFGVNISVQSGHSGSEVCLFVHTRNGVQRGIMACKGDFDTGGSPYAAFNVRAGDVIEVYFVDGLTNDAGVNPSVL
ncbi:MAG TPA: Ig-like domain-containing protein, partial [Lachnospiraceae bacterium]|nr:Ig-like domain-containing protein [Lachnospiraceae bacterium]